MTPTYRALELAATSLVDAVNECDLNGESGPHDLMTAVADMCDALGSSMAAHKARHRLSGALAFTWEDAAGVEQRDATIEQLALDVRGAVIPWSDGRSPEALRIDGLAAVVPLLNDLAEAIRDIDPVSDYAVIDGCRPDVPDADALEQAASVAETAAEIVDEALAAAQGSDLEALADTLADREDIADPVETLVCVAAALDGARLDASAVDDAIQAAKRGAVLDDLAAGIIEAHEAGASFGALLESIAAALRGAGRDDAAAVLVGRP